MKTTEENN